MFGKTKRFLAFALMVVMLFTLAPLPVLAKGSSDKTQQEAVDWLMAQVGQAVDEDGQFASQCVDLVRLYYKDFFDTNPVSGNGCDYWTNALPSGFVRIPYSFGTGFVAMPGDIAVWGTGFSAGVGHVAVVISADTVGFTAVSQNSTSRSSKDSNLSYIYQPDTSKWKTVKEVNYKFTAEDFKGVIRPDFDGGSLSHIVPTTPPSYDNGTEITSEFTDPNFLAIVRNITRKINNEPIYDYDVWGYNSLDLNNQNIETLAGIRYFTDLERLDVSGNSLKSLNIEYNTELVELNCSNNELSSLSFYYDFSTKRYTSTGSIVALDCSKNRLKSLDITGLALEKFDCSENELETLRFRGSSSLKRLDYSDNHLVSEDSEFLGVHISGINTDELEWFWDNDQTPYSPMTDNLAGFTPISTREQLEEMNQNLSGRYYLTNDIDLSGEDWTPIGTYDNPFNGKLYGRGYSVKNMTITTAAGNRYIGFFGYAFNGAEIVNLGLEDVNINLTYNVAGDGLIGGIAGMSQNISECFVTGNISVTSNTEHVYVGGIVGYGGARRSYNSANISANGNAGYRSSVGGIVGWNVSDISDCYNTGNLGGSGEVGGIAGTNASVISNCYNAGDLNSEKYWGGAYVGGIAGLTILYGSPLGGIFKSVVLSKKITPLFADGYGGTIGGGGYLITAKTSSDGYEERFSNNLAIHGIDGEYTNDAGKMINTEEAVQGATYSDIGWEMDFALDSVFTSVDAVWKMPKNGGFPILGWVDDSKESVTPDLSNNDFVVENGVLVAYNGPGGDVVIPDGVTAIGAYTFFDNSADKNLNKITSITIPDSVTQLLPRDEDDVKGLGGTFSGCGYKLEKLYIGSGLTTIKTDFYNCENISIVEVSQNNPYIKSVDNVVFSKDGKTLLWHSGGIKDSKYTVPNGVETIDDYAFSWDLKGNIKEVVLPEGAKKIGEGAFALTLLEKLTIPSSVTEIGEGAVRYPSVTIYGYMGSVTEQYCMTNEIKFVVLNTNPIIPKTGDVNSDGEIGEADVTLIKRYLAGWNVSPFNKATADVNADNKINDVDVVILKRFLAHWDITLG